MIVYITCTAVRKRLIRFANKYMSLAGREVVSGKTVSEVLSTSGSRAHTTDLTQRLSKQYRSEKNSYVTMICRQWSVRIGGKKAKIFPIRAGYGYSKKKIYTSLRYLFHFIL